MSYTEDQGVKMDVKSGKINLQKLLMPTPTHPNGRVQIDPATGMPKNPKNNVIGYKERLIKFEGRVIGKQKIEVNGGHAKADGSVWRLGLGGPEKYHKKVLADQERFQLTGKRDVTAPTLEIEEAREYAAYEAYLDEAKKALASNEEFYAWFKDKKVEVRDGELMIVTEGGEAKPARRKKK